MLYSIYHMLLNYSEITFFARKHFVIMYAKVVMDVITWCVTND